MNTQAWLDGNNRYLGESLKWLRGRLAQLVPEEDARHAVTLKLAPQVTKPQSRPGFLGRLFGAKPAADNDVPRLTQVKPLSGEDEVAQAAASREAAADIQPPPALIVLAERLGLSDFERDTLLLCAAMELDPDMGRLCSLAQGSEARNYPTFELALSLFDDASWDALSAQRPLRYARLIEINSGGATPLTASPLRADERVVGFLKGLNVLDERLSTLLRPATLGGSARLSDSQEAVGKRILEHLKYAAGETLLPVTQLIGEDRGSKLAVAQQVCASLKRRLYLIDGDALPTQVEEIENLSRLWQRESLLLPVALYIDSEDISETRAEGNTPIQRLLSREVGLTFVGARETPLQLACPNAAFDVAKPTRTEQHAAWKAALGGDEISPVLEGSARALAGQFDLNLDDISEAMNQASARTTDPGVLRQSLWESCRDITRPRLDLLAQRLEAKATWDDIVLSDEAMSLLRQIAGQVRERHKVYDEWGFAEKMNRGFGISALFTGESGTGKTMAAEVIANDLRLNLYRIDLSAVVSKYIGETEKNLRKLFDAAEQGGAILFFDEADALFGKRSEVKDSHDRYANIEINYLLQRMESFSGLAILATNMKAALDPAFMRRLRFIVNFRFPGIKERMRIWEKSLPSRTPHNALDFERLARLNVTGGNIHSITLHAAFLAAQNDQAITMPILLTAARTELRKLEKPFNEAQLR